MEHESFEDEKVAEIMNEYYVNIKGIKKKKNRHQLITIYCYIS